MWIIQALVSYTLIYNKNALLPNVCVLPIGISHPVIGWESISAPVSHQVIHKVPTCALIVAIVLIERLIRMDNEGVDKNTYGEHPSCPD